MTKVSTFLIRQQIKKCRCELVMEGPQNYFLVVELNARSNTHYTGLPTKENSYKKTCIFSNMMIELEHLINGKSNYFKKNEKKITIAGNHYWRINAQ